MKSIESLTAEILVDDNAASAIRDAYRRRTPASARAFERARQCQPGGVSRQVGHWAPYPVTMRRGDGPFLWDLDDNRYIDLLGNFTSLVHGNNYGPIREAVAEALPRGTAWAANNEAQVELAEVLVERVPGVDQVRFTNSGTEAGNLALLIARAVTGRHKVLMARFGYHGGVHEFEVGSFNLDGPNTFLADFGDAASFEAVLDRHGEEIAAVFLEGVLGAGGMRPAPAAFFEDVRAAAHRHGAMFVMDEVISLRLGPRGQQGNLGFTSDLTMLGKLIGGGFPVGAVGGPREVMDVFRSDKLKVWHSGTFNANPVTMTAGAVAVRELTPARIAGMDRLAALLKDGLVAAAATRGLPFSVRHVGSLLNVFFTDSPPDDITARDDHDEIRKYHVACLNRGLMIASRGMFVISTVMDERLIGEVIERATAAMDDVVAETPRA